jgi:DNA-binding winged helix-turn-helix (wHTH) protein/Tol biopolymer transport system component
MEEVANSARIVRFGAFEVDLRAGELRKNGLKIKLQEQPLQVLTMLLRHPGEVVTREELRKAVWPADTFVDFDRGLNKAINKIREALGDSADNPRFVETLPRRGYRFIAPVDGRVAVGAGLPTATGQVAPPKVAPEGEPLGGTRAPQGLPLQATAGGAVGEPVLRTRRGLRAAALLAMLVVGVAVGWLVWNRSRSLPELKQRQITANPPEDFVKTGAISPDGKYIAYRDQTGLYLRSVDSGETHAVPLPAGFSNGIIGLEWFPDGGKLVAVVNNPHPNDLWVITILGEARPQLVYRNGFAPEISPDGQRLAFMSCCMKEGSLQEILVGGINDETPRKLVSAEEISPTKRPWTEQSVWYPAWSPDGRWIAYVRKWKTAQGSQRSAIEVRPASGGPAKTLLSEASLPKASSLCSVLMDGHPCMVWSPDWRLVFNASQGPESPFAQTKYSLWQVQAEPRTGEAAGRPGQLTPWSDSYPTDLASTRDGKHLSLLKWLAWDDVYLAELGPGGTSTKPPRRLTLDNRGILTLDSWTPDSQAILFSSSRNGSAEVFRKGLNENIDEAIVRGLEGYRSARLTPDGTWMLYVEWSPTALGVPPTPDRMMRRLVAGGSPDMVLQESGGALALLDYRFYVWDYKCPLRPGSPCVLGEKNGNDLDFYSLDPVRGKGKQLGKAAGVAFQNCCMYWDVSPDGSRLALIGRANHGGRIEVLTFSENTWQEISPERPFGSPLTIAWAADGKGLFVNFWDKDPPLDLLHITLGGKLERVIQNGYGQSHPAGRDNGPAGTFCRPPTGSSWPIRLRRRTATSGCSRTFKSSL